jgi:CrcB protein
MTANIAGSLLMGLLYILFLERLAGNEELRLALTTGFLGAFTTFSTFSVETLLLFEGGELIKAVSNVLITVIVCLFAAWLGMKLGRLL